MDFHYGKLLKSTLDAYAQFEDNYPESDLLKDLGSTYNKIQNTLIVLKKMIGDGGDPILVFEVRNNIYTKGSFLF